MMQFFCNMYDTSDCEINSQPLVICADSLKHALLKITAYLTDDCVEVQIWQRKEQPND